MGLVCATIHWDPTNEDDQHFVALNKLRKKHGLEKDSGCGGCYREGKTSFTVELGGLWLLWYDARRISRVFLYEAREYLERKGVKNVETMVDRLPM